MGGAFPAAPEGIGISIYCYQERIRDVPLLLRVLGCDFHRVGGERALALGNRFQALGRKRRGTAPLVLVKPSRQQKCASPTLHSGQHMQRTRK